MLEDKMKLISLAFATLLTISSYTTQVTAAAAGAEDDVDAVTFTTVTTKHHKDGHLEHSQKSMHFGSGAKKDEAEAVSLGLFDKVKDLGKKAVDTAKNLGGKAIDKAKDLGGKAVDAGKQVASAALDSTVNYITNPDNLIKIAKGGLDAGMAFATGGTAGLTDHVKDKVTGGSKKPAAKADNDE